MKLGVYAQNQQDRFQAAIIAHGGTVTWQRLYFTTQTASGMTLVSTRAAAGYKVYVSFGPNGTTWEQITAGTENARWTGIGNMLAAIPNAGAWCFDPEPEDNRATFGSAANGATFIAAWEKVASIIKPLAPSWQASINLSDKIFPQWVVEYGGRGASWVASPSPNDWWSAQANLFGLSYRAPRGWPTSGTTWAANAAGWPDSFAAISEALSYAASWGVPMCLPEFAALTRDITAFPVDNTDRAAWLLSIADDFALNSNITAVMYLEVNNQEDVARPNWAITDTDQPAIDSATVGAFAALDVLPEYNDTYGNPYVGVSAFGTYERSAALSGTAGIASAGANFSTLLGTVALSATAVFTVASTGGTAVFQRQAALDATATFAAASQKQSHRSVLVSVFAVVAAAGDNQSQIGGPQPEFGIWEELERPDSVDATVRPESFRMTDFEPAGR